MWLVATGAASGTCSAPIDRASGEAPAQGCVGAGTGTTALGYKAGIGTSSRVVRTAGTSVTVGALVQANFGGVLSVLGVPLPVDELVPQADRTEPPGNSCMILVATDAPLDTRQLGRLARRAVFAMGPPLTLHPAPRPSTSRPVARALTHRIPTEETTGRLANRPIKPLPEDPVTQS